MVSLHSNGTETKAVAYGVYSVCLCECGNYLLEPGMISNEHTAKDSDSSPRLCHYLIAQR